MVSDKKMFSCFPYISLFKTCDPRGGTIFGPGGIFRKNLVDINSLGLMVSDKKIFSCFPYISFCKICDPQGGAIGII